MDLEKFDKYLVEAAIDMNVYKGVVKKLKDQWKRVHGTGAAARYGAWILEPYKTEKEFLNAPVEIADQQTGRWKNYKNLKAALKDFPDLDDFSAGMRGSDNRIRFERAAKTRY